jgi:hypothetical protein
MAPIFASVSFLSVREGTLNVRAIPSSIYSVLPAKKEIGTKN